MSIFRKRAISEQQAQTLAMTEVVTKALQQSFAAQGQQIEVFSKFLGVLGDLSAKQAAKIMGQRGGRRTQQRKREAREAAQKRGACPLCIDPMRRDVTVEMVTFHRQHEANIPEEPQQIEEPPPELPN